MNTYENEKIQGLYCPSFKVERKTKAFNKYIAGPVSLLATFPVCVGVIAAYHTFMCFYLELVSTAINDYLVVALLLPVVACIVYIYKDVLLLNALLISYKIEGNRIIKGRIVEPIRIDREGKRAALRASVSMAMEGGVQGMRAGSTVMRGFRIFQMIDNNTNPLLVQNNFDTEVYKKTIYENPKLVKSTRYTLVYRCDGNKKLVIPKIYDGMFPVGDKESSLLGRILAKTAIVTGVAFLIATIDLVVGYSNNQGYASNIADTQEVMMPELEPYGYTIEKNSERSCAFTKERDDGKDNSYVGYTFDKHGAVTNVSIQLYYPNDYESVSDELSYILSTVDDSFDEVEVEEFLKKVENSVNGDYQYGILQGDKYKLTIATSETYIDIHSY